MKKISLKILIILFIPFLKSFAQEIANDSSRIEQIISTMTLSEKIDYISGYEGFYIRPIEKFGIPKIKFSDGPVGVRNYGKATAFPAAIASAASWDRDLIYKVGAALGKESRARGVHVLLAPGVNIYRAPMCGRNFEYFGEDPYLASQLVVPYIKGVQEQGVAATVKHYVANNQEFDRHHVSSDVDERTLREIYLPAFKAAVQKGDVATLMTAYNLINGIHASQHDYLVNKILKEEWGFDGVVMSDWNSVYDAVGAANGGLDLEMPSGKFMNKENLLPAIKDSSLKQSVIDDKVRRILRMILRMGFMERKQLDKSIPLNNSESAKIALKLAEESIVLLKNENNILPIKRDKVRTIAVIGPNSDPAVIGGGGSSLTIPFNSVSVVQGIKDYAGEKYKIKYKTILKPEQEAYLTSKYYFNGKQGLSGEYFNNTDLSGEPVLKRFDKRVNFNWIGEKPCKELEDVFYSVRWQGEINVEKDGEYEFFLRGDDGFRLYLDDKLIIDDWNNNGTRTKSYKLKMNKWETHGIRIEFFQASGGSEIYFGWQEVNNDLESLHKKQYRETLEMAKKADVVVVCIGFNKEIEREAIDRPFSLPADQVKLIKDLAAKNKNIVAVVNGGGNVNIEPWLGDVNALLHAWYPGQDGGTAIANILFGAVNPSGKLPITIEKKWEDNATYTSYFDDDNDKHVSYTEGLFLGYRHHDKNNVEALFPFGFGLSYTNYKYSNIQLSENSMVESDTLWVSFDVTNTGKIGGYEITQLYINDTKASVARPVKELKGFEKVYLGAGESKTIRIPIDRESLSFYDVEAKSWKAESGKFIVMIGASSQDIRLEKSFSLQ